MALNAVQGSPVSVAPGSVTPLYGLRPQHVGVGQIESLQSYLYALAHAHSFAISTLTYRVIPLLARQYGVECPRDLTTWAKSASSCLTVIPGFARKLAECLSALTGRNEVRNTTLTPALQFVAGQQLQAQASRVCRRCLLDDEARGALPYGRLLWSIWSVSCCPLHGIALVKAKCGAGQAPRKAFQVTKKRYGGSCGSCGSGAFRCLSAIDEQADELEIWKARQVAEAIERFSTLQETSLVRLKSALQSYCDDRDGCAQLARRFGVTKSSLSRWLNVPTARLSLAAMLDLCASEGFSLARLLNADLAKTEWPTSVVPSRAKRKVPRLDRLRVEIALDAALAQGKRVAEVAAEEAVDRKTLERLGERFQQLRHQNALQRRLKRKAQTEAAVAEAEAVMSKLVLAGKLPSAGNARLVTKTVWLTSQTRCLALICLRIKLGDTNARLPARSVVLNRQLQEEVAKAAERLRRTLPASYPDTMPSHEVATASLTS